MWFKCCWSNSTNTILTNLIWSNCQFSQYWNHHKNKFLQSHMLSQNCLPAIKTAQPQTSKSETCFPCSTNTYLRPAFLQQRQHIHIQTNLKSRKHNHTHKHVWDLLIYNQDSTTTYKQICLPTIKIAQSHTNLFETCLPTDSTITHKNILRSVYLQSRQHNHTNIF